VEERRARAPDPRSSALGRKGPTRSPSERRSLDFGWARGSGSSRCRI
jgi:hypothetical protein